MQQLTKHLRFQTAEATANFGAGLAPMLGAGDVILLRGGLGAGKTHFARSVIQARLAQIGLAEDIPSPTYTLVQTYDLGAIEIWHADLYRLSGPDEVYELGLDQAFTTAICLIEWPDRLQDDAPHNALSIEFQMTDQPGERLAQMEWRDPKWSDLLNSACADA